MKFGRLYLDGMPVVAIKLLFGNRIIINNNENIYHVF